MGWTSAERPHDESSVPRAQSRQVACGAPAAESPQCASRRHRPAMQTSRRLLRRPEWAGAPARRPERAGAPDSCLEAALLADMPRSPARLADARPSEPLLGPSGWMRHSPALGSGRGVKGPLVRSALSTPGYRIPERCEREHEYTSARHFSGPQYLAEWTSR